MVKQNIKYKPYVPMSRWRKLAISSWRTSEEASFYGWVDFDAKPLKELLHRLQEQGTKISPTAIAAKAVAVAISRYPKVNGVIRFGRIYHRQSVDIFFQVAPDDSGDNLTGIVIRECDKKSLEEIHTEIKERAERVRKGVDDFAGFGEVMKFIPTFLIGWMQRLVSFICYQLNIWSPAFGIPQDAFGSAMVTSVGMLGIQRGFAPLLPFVECPIIVAIGKIEQKPIVRDGKVEIIDVLPVCATMDHRLVDGVGASRMMKALTEYFKEPF